MTSFTDFLIKKLNLVTYNKGFSKDNFNTINSQYIEYINHKCSDIKRYRITTRKMVNVKTVWYFLNSTMGSSNYC